MKDNKLTRRDMMKYSASVAAGVIMVSGCRQQRRQRASKGFKIGVCDWSMGKKTDPGALELAKQLGIDGVQVDFGKPQGDGLQLFDRQLQKKYLALAKQHDTEICSLAMGILNGIAYKSDPRAEKWVDKAIDVCREMKKGIILLAFFGKGDLRNDSKGMDVVVERLKRVAPKAESAGVVLGIESMLSGQEHMDIINRVGSRAVQVYYDVGNSHRAGYDIYEEIRDFGIENLCEVHAKDYGNLFGEGKVDFVKVRQALDDIGYRGWIVIEGAKPLGLKESYRRNEQYLRTIFPRKV